jgi:hypothetical protein
MDWRVWRHRVSPAHSIHVSFRWRLPIAACESSSPYLYFIGSVLLVPGLNKAEGVKWNHPELPQRRSRPVPVRQLPAAGNRHMMGVWSIA